MGVELGSKAVGEGDGVSVGVGVAVGVAEADTGVFCVAVGVEPPDTQPESTTAVMRRRYKPCSFIFWSPTLIVNGT